MIAEFLRLMPMLGQAASVRTFEVVSVKVHEGPTSTMGVTTAGQRLNSIDFAAGLILYAYHLRNDQLIRTPALLAMGDTLYEVMAKADGETTPTKEEFRQMTQALLADRFGLKVHREMRETPVYELVVGRNGPKLKASEPGASGPRRLSVSGRNYVVTMPAASMEDVIAAIENSFPDRPVVDKTGLTGTYALTLTYTPDTRANHDNPDPADLSIFTAVQEQLGLKLEPRKAMVEVLIVDSIGKPSAN